MKFERLTRAAMRALKPGESIFENGIKYTKLPNGDGRFGVNLMVNGKRIQRVVGNESADVTREKVEEYIAKVKTEAREERLNLPKGRKLAMSFEEAAEKYQLIMQEIGGKNLVKKEQHLRMHLIPFFKATRLAQIDPDTIDRYKQHRLKAGAAVATVNRELATLSHLLSKAVDRGWIMARPRKIGLMKEDNAREVALTSAEAQALLEAARLLDPQLYLFCRMGLSAGMRNMEILSIRISNIDMEHKSIYLPKTKTGPRHQKISSDLASYLQWYLKQHCYDGQVWLFPSKLGTKVGHRTSIDDSFRTAVINAGLDPKKVTPHTMRHTVGTWASEAGLDPKAGMLLLGHKTLAMRLRYDHAREERVQTAADTIDVFLRREA